jgi:adenylate cyclase
MNPIKLKRVVARKNIAELLQSFADAFALPVSVLDRNGRLIFGPAGGDDGKAPVVVETSTIGYARGDMAVAGLVATTLGCVATLEHEKATLGNEALIMYNELALLYDLAPTLVRLITEKDEHALSEQVTTWMQSLFTADCGAFLLQEEKTGPRVLAGFGQEALLATVLKQAKGFVQDCMRQGRPDIVHEPITDYRFSLEQPPETTSFLCAPVRAEEEPLGALLLASRTPDFFLARDLKLLHSLGCQIAMAMQNHRRGIRLLKAAELFGPA